jgi:hypothetical protein
LLTSLSKIIKINITTVIKKKRLITVDKQYEGVLISIIVQIRNVTIHFETQLFVFSTHYRFYIRQKKETEKEEEEEEQMVIPGMITFATASPKKVLMLSTVVAVAEV